MSSTMKQVLGEMSAFEVGIDAPGVPGACLNPGVVKPARERPAFDEKVDLETGQQDGVERPDNELVLADSKDAHVRNRTRS